MSLAVEWRLYGDDLRSRWLSVRVDPRCRVFTKMRVIGDDVDERCGKLATVRAHRFPYWSEVFCPEHAADFNGARE